MVTKVIKYIGLFLFITGCAGTQRDCSSNCASEYGGDWIIVQYRFDGSPINCWELKDTAVSNESGTDGIYWQDPNGHLVHISGWYNRVQVKNNRWDQAAKTLGVDDALCKDGVYLKPMLDGGK